MKDMDCESCYKRDTCKVTLPKAKLSAPFGADGSGRIEDSDFATEDAQAGMFCAEYANKEPDPNHVEDEDETWE